MKMGLNCWKEVLFSNDAINEETIKGLQRLKLGGIQSGPLKDRLNSIAEDEARFWFKIQDYFNGTWRNAVSTSRVVWSRGRRLHISASVPHEPLGCDDSSLAYAWIPFRKHCIREWHCRGCSGCAVGGFQKSWTPYGTDDTRNLQWSNQL